jgi:hypothetical protein
MALPILMNDGPILIETPVAERAFADLAAIPFDNFIKRRKHRVGHIYLPCCPDTDRRSHELDGKRSQWERGSPTHGT